MHIHTPVATAPKLAIAAIAVLGAFALTPTTADAGGVGVTLGGGVHQDRAYYYNEEGEQGIDTQLPMNTGWGGELLLGDRDNRVLGIVRGYVSRDAPLKNPDPSALGEGPGEYVFPNVEKDGHTTRGAAAVGMQWGLWGDPNGFQMIATSLIGSQFWTNDNLETATFQAGVGVTYTANERYQFAASLDATSRFRKRFQWGGDVWLSARYMFD
jgi:hypothetical protein